TDIENRKDYINLLLEKNKKLLRYQDEIEQQIVYLTRERDLYTSILENERTRPYIQGLEQKTLDFIRSFRSCAYVEDQDKKIKRFYETLKSQMKSYLEKQKASPFEIDKAFVRLRRYLMTKIYSR